jgi:hypothetical protein
MAMAVAVALLGSGCWSETCEQYEPSMGVFTCRDRLTGIFNSPDDPYPDSWCPGGEVTAGSTCRGQGYTEECGGVSVKPPSGLLPQCR